MVALCPIGIVPDRFLRRLSRLCRRARRTTHISEHIALHPTVQSVLLFPRGSSSRESLSRTGPSPGRRSGEVGVGAVEEEFTGTFLLTAPSDAEPFCGRSHELKLVWKACESPWCHMFLRASCETLAWRRNSSCSQTHSYCSTATWRLAAAGRHIDHTPHCAWCTSCKCWQNRHTNWRRPP